MANFRASYLASLGFEKETLARSEFDTLLLEESISLLSLRKLCARVGCVPKWRKTVWKLLLGVLPPFRQAWNISDEAEKNIYSSYSIVAAMIQKYRLHDSNVMEQLLEGKNITGDTILIRTPSIVDAYLEEKLSDADHNRVRSILITYGVRKVVHRNDFDKTIVAPSRSKLRDIAPLFLSKDLPKLYSICSVLCKVFDDDQDVFSCLIKFMQMLEIRNTSTTSSLNMIVWHRIRLLSELLFRETPQFQEYMHNVLRIREDDYASVWFRSYFAESFADKSLLIPLWDRLIGAPGDFVVYVGLEIIKPLIGKIVESKMSVTDVMEMLVNITHISDIEKLLNSSSTNLALMDDDKKTPLRPFFMLNLEWPVLKVGDSGPLVTTFQYLLCSHGFGNFFSVDSYFGKRTLNALKGFRIKVSRKTDPEATNDLDKLKIGDEINLSLDWPHLIKILSSQSRGDAVRALQVLLRVLGYSVRVDGYFGPKTVECVKDFQEHRAAHIIPIDGVVGIITWMNLLNI